MKHQQGFTLLELMTTLGIATILVSVAVPGLQEFKKNSRQRSATNELVSTMHVARNTAITTNTRVTVCASRNGTSCDNVSWSSGYIAFVDTDGDRVLDGNETVLRAGERSDNVDISSAQFGSFFVYRPNGRVMNANVSQNSGLFMICDDRGTSYSRSIQLDLSGRARSASNYGYEGGGGGGVVVATCPSIQ